MSRQIFHVRVSCPDWLDKPLMLAIPLLYAALVVCLAIFFTPWFLFMFLLFPVTKPAELNEKEKMNRLDKWRRSQVPKLKIKK